MIHSEVSDRGSYWALPLGQFKLYQRRTDAWNNAFEQLCDLSAIEYVDMTYHERMEWFENLSVNNPWKIYQDSYFIPGNINYVE